MYGSRNLGNSRREIEAVVAMTRDISELVGVVLDESEMTFLKTLSSWE